MAGGRFSVEAVFRAVDRMSAPVIAMNARVSKFTKSMESGLKTIDGLNSKISSGIKTTGAALAASAAGVAYVGYNVAKTGADFEQAITNVGAVSLMTRGQIQDLENEARRLGATTKFTAAEVAAGMELMGRAGFKNSEILQGIGGILAASAAEGAEIAEISSVVSNALKGMGLATTDATRVADVLTLASARTNSSIVSLGESMKNVAPVARQFKIPFEDTVTAVALLQDVGLDASEAGTATATMLTKLASPTDAIAAQMRRLGVTFQDSQKNMLPLGEVLENMSLAAKKSGGNMKVVAFFAELVGLRGQKAALNLQEMFKSGKFDELAKELGDAAGSAKKMADIRMDTLRGDWTLLESTVDDLKISLFDMNGGPLRGIVQGMTAWVDANKELIKTRVGEFATSLSDWAAKNKGTFIQVGRAIGGGLQWVAQNMPKIISWVERFGKTALYFYAFSTAVKVTMVAIQAYEASVAVAKATQWLFVASMKATRVAGGGAATALSHAGDMMGVFNREAAAGKAGMAGLREGLNASLLGKQINGVAGLLGRAGLLGAALAVGYVFGSWLNDTLKLDEQINDLIDTLGGIDRTKVPGGPSNESVARHEKAVGDAQFLKNEEQLQKTAMAGTPLMRKAFLARQKQVHARNPDAPQVVSPQERVAESITQTTETQKTEITIKDETGKAQVTKEPKKRGRTSIRLQPSGAF